MSAIGERRIGRTLALLDPGSDQEQAFAVLVDAARTWVGMCGHDSGSRWIAARAIQAVDEAVEFGNAPRMLDDELLRAWVREQFANIGFDKQTEQFR